MSAGREEGISYFLACLSSSGTGARPKAGRLHNVGREDGVLEGWHRGYVETRCYTGRMNFRAASKSRRAKIVAVACFAFMSPMQGIPVAAAPATAPSEGFADAAIRARWAADEGCTDCGAHVWMWGPGAFYTEYEPYSGTPEGNHLVQYFDKGRLEINDPQGDKSSPWYVTSGLLVKEMVAGAAETGEGSLYRIGPANVSVAGDGDGGPTYAQFADLTGRADNQEGRPLGDASFLHVNGGIAELTTEGDAPVSIKIGRYEEASGHNWADVFWSFASSMAGSGGAGGCRRLVIRLQSRTGLRCR